MFHLFRWGGINIPVKLFGNSDFLINCLNWLVDEDGLMELRSRELKLRLLNKQVIKTERLKWQMINIAGPLTIVVLAGLLFGFLRRKKYTGYQLMNKILIRIILLAVISGLVIFCIAEGQITFWKEQQLFRTRA